MFDTMPIGTKFYYVYKKYNTSARNKITVIDADGIEWHRYIKPQVEYVVNEYTLVGRLKKVLEGKWTYDSELDTEYLVDNGEKVHDFYFDDDEKYYLNRDEAVAEAERLNKELKENERY
jgi:hypothetical protein